MGASWQAVARKLAARMRHHAECSDHDSADPDPDCPFCSDRAAYELFVAKDAAFNARRQARDGSPAFQRAHRTDVEIVSVRKLLEEAEGEWTEIPAGAGQGRECTCGAIGTGRGHSHGCPHWNEAEYRSQPWRRKA